jgi:SAM-dependent methyltransferase
MRPMTTPAWFPDETAYAGRENFDEAHVARYDGKEDADADAEVRLLQDAGMTRSSRVVEFGPGTGQFTVCVARSCAHVTAVDVSPVMLERLEARVRGQENVDVVRAGFLSYVHEGPPADVVYSRLALHHLPDFWKAIALTRLRQILRPGGLLRLWDVVYDFDPSDAVDRIEAWCASGTDAVDTGWTRAELEEHVRDEHSTFTWLLEPILARAGFATLDAEHSADGIWAKYLLKAH